MLDSMTQLESQILTVLLIALVVVILSVVQMLSLFASFRSSGRFKRDVFWSPLSLLFSKSVA